MKPVILITAKPAPDDFGVGGINKTQTNYCYAINQAGGLPIVSAWGDAQQYAQLADGILFTGSAYDISPELYHQENRSSKDCKMDLDEMELALFDAFYRVGKPIMGICRGLQLINVALGGSLIQDIPQEVETLTVHQKVYQKETVYHPVTAKEGSLFCHLFGKDFTTNSYHHQAIGACAPGLVATVTTEEGIIEAVEHETKPIFATQWHPERMVGQEQTELPNMLPLFLHFIELCKK